MKNMMKNEKGITLIALIITIIVLLILAGVSIAMLTGENGILSRAESTEYSTAEGQFREALAMASSEITMNRYDTSYTGSNNTLSADSLKSVIDANLYMTDFTLTVSGTNLTAVNTSGTVNMTAALSIDGQVYGGATITDNN